MSSDLVSSRDIFALEAWLDDRKIPREQQQVPWEQPKQLKLSDRVLMLWRNTDLTAQERGYKSAQFDEEQTRRKTALECALIVRDLEPDIAFRVAERFGISGDELQSAIEAQMREMFDDDTEESAGDECYGRIGCACHNHPR